LYVNPGGALRFGTAALGGLANYTAGTGNIFINPGATVQLEAASNINTTALQKIEVRSTADKPGILQLNTAMDPATLVSSTSTGLLQVNVATFGTALNLTSIGDGSFQLGAAVNTSYTANTLGVGSGNSYRIGGTGAFTLTLAPTTATSPVLTGTAKALFGSLAATGNTVALNQTNNYSGGTTIARGMTVSFTTGTSNTPFGSAAVDVFGTVVASTTTGSFLGASTTNTNSVIFHPGAILKLDSSVTNNANRWEDAKALTLDGTQVWTIGLANNAVSETVGSFTFNRGSSIKTASGTGTGSLVLTGGAGTSFTRTGTGTMVFLPTAGKLGLTGS